VKKAVFYALDSCIGIWWNPEARSNTPKYFGLLNWSNISIIPNIYNIRKRIRISCFFRSIRENLSPFSIFYCPVNLIFWRQPTRMNYMVNLKAWLSFIIKSFTCLLISFLWKGGNLLFSIYESIIEQFYVHLHWHSLTARSETETNRYIY